MRCRIADLIVEIPATGGLAPRCQAYLTDSSQPVDIVIPSKVPFPARIAFCIGPVGEEVEFFAEK